MAPRRVYSRGGSFFSSPSPACGGGNKKSLLRHEGAGRNVLGHHVSMVERVEHHPQHVALEFERLENERLLLRRFRVLPHIGECKVAVAARLGRPGGEIRERLGGDEIVVFEHALDALADDERRKQFGERGGDGLEQRLFGDEMHIGFDRKARCRKQALKRRDVVAVKSKTVGELEPARNAAFAGRIAVVVDEAAAPLAPHVAVKAARDQARILHRDHRLVVVAVERPRLDLALGAFAAMEQMMERVQAVVAPRPDVTQLGFQLVRSEQCRHNSILIPSSATSKPAASTARRCGEPSIRIGLVLLMWIKIRRRPRPASAAKVPSGPPTGMWPMRRPVFAPAPAAIISSSENSVPSNSTTSASVRRDEIADVSLAAPGMNTSRAPWARSSIPTLASVSASRSGLSLSR